MTLPQTLKHIRHDFNTLLSILELCNPQQQLYRYHQDIETLSALGINSMELMGEESNERVSAH